MPEPSDDPRETPRSDYQTGFGAHAADTGNDCGAMLHRLYHFLDGELTVERRQVI